MAQTNAIAIAMDSVNSSTRPSSGMLAGTGTLPVPNAVRAPSDHRPMSDPKDADANASRDASIES